MKKIKVNLGQNSHEIHIGSGLLTQVGEELKRLGLKGKAVVITNPNVNRLWGESLKTSLEEACFSTYVLEIPDGEIYKTLDQASKLYEKLSELQAERGTPVLAMGGGVIGDLAGFVAATYMRGVPLIQIPTSLLAQVDSSIGGKVAVDHGSLKNTVGSFYQPRLVVADIRTLKTLPEVEYTNGLAEVIKYGAILDRDLFKVVESEAKHFTSADEGFLGNVICRSVEIKAGIVEKDEKDTGLRNILNYGHTIGHAIETVSEFKLKHGSAVAIGMAAAGRISQKMGFLNQSEMARIETVLSRTGLPVSITGLDIAEIMEAMKHDKKIVGGKIRFVLLRAIGEVFTTEEVNTLLVEQVLKELL